MDKKIYVLNALASFVKRASKKGATAEEIALLPAVAKVLTLFFASFRPYSTISGRKENKVKEAKKE